MRVADKVAAACQLAALQATARGELTDRLRDWLTAQHHDPAAFRGFLQRIGATGLD